MLQYFIPHNSKELAPTTSCQLRSVCRIDSRHGKLPRTMHAHEDRAEWILVTSGHGRFNIDTGHYLAKTGDILFFDSHSLHDETTVNGNLTTSCLAVSGFQLPGRRPNAMVGQLFSPLLHLGKAFPAVHALFETLIDLAYAKEDITVLDQLTLAILLKLDAELQHHGAPPHSQQDTLGFTVKAYIDQHYREEISLETIAKHFNFNAYYLAHTFKKQIGYSPMQYIIRRRIGEAQNLLISSNDSITNIALDCGYNNSNYFQRVFKTMVGMTPGQYRKDWSRQ